MKIQAGNVATPPPVGHAPDGGVRLLSAPKPLVEHEAPAITPHEARETFKSMAGKTADQIEHSAGIPSASLDALKAATIDLFQGVDGHSLTVAQIKAATQAMHQVGVATQLLESSTAQELSPNDFARTLVSHASTLEKQGRAMAKDPATAEAAAALQDVASALRRAVGDNYAASGHIEAYSLKEAANFRALHFEGASAVLDEIKSGLLEQLNQPGLSTAERHKIQDQIKGLDQYKAELGAQADKFRSDRYQDNADKTADRKAIIKLMGGSLHKFEAKKITSLGGMIRAKMGKVAVGLSGRLGKPLPESLGKLHLKSAMAAHMRGRLQALGLPSEQTPSLEKLRVRIGDAYKDGVQKQPWRNIERQLTMTAPGKGDGDAAQQKFENRLTRARDLHNDLSASYGADGLEGVSSLANKEARHVVNLWHTEYRPTQPAGFEFTGLRHGIHDAYKIKDPIDRIKAADARVQEFLKAAAATAPPERFTRNPDGTLGLTVVSMSLVTPAAVGGDEKAMLQHQVDAYERANLLHAHKGIEVRLPQPDGSYKTEIVKPQVVAFNSGVNSWSLGKGRDLFGGWGPSDRLNRESAKALVGDLGSGGSLGGLAGQKVAALRAQLSNPALSPEQELHARQQIGVIQDLAQQVVDMLASGSHHHVGNEPYKFPVRIMALAQECGATPAFNCKSGKDRTGQLDVEIKDFYTDLNFNGQARALDHVRNDIEKVNLKTLFEQGGGREVQKVNTGVPGSKVDLKVYYDQYQFSDQDKVDDLKGLSKWVGA